MNVEQRQALNKAVSELNKMDQMGDAEGLHSYAEDIICGLLKEIGFGEASEAFESARDRVGFWYA